MRPGTPPLHHSITPSLPSRSHGQEMVGVGANPGVWRVGVCSDDMKRLFPAIILAALGLVAALGGCAFTKADPSAGTTLEIAVFEGGYGLDWHRQVAREYEKLHPGIR